MRKKGKAMISVSLRLPLELHSQIGPVAHALGISKQQLFIESLTDYMVNSEQKAREKLAEAIETLNSVRREHPKDGE